MKEQLKVAKESALNIWNVKKIELAKKWIDNSEIQRKRSMIQNAVYLCDLGENIGSEQSNFRPVVIISNNKFNNGNNVVIVPLSTTLKTTINKKGVEVPKYRTHYFLKKSKYTFLSKDSCAKCEHITTVSRIRLGAYLGSIDSEDLDKIKIRISGIF